MKAEDVYALRKDLLATIGTKASWGKLELQRVIDDAVIRWLAERLEK